MSIKYCPTCHCLPAMRGYVPVEGNPDATKLCPNNIHSFTPKEAQKKFWEKNNEVEHYFGDAQTTTGSVTGSGSYTTSAMCHESHKPFAMGTGQLFGGSASRSRNGYDVYVSLTDSASDARGRLPWLPQGPTVSFAFPVPDMGIPKDEAAFKAMACWIAQQLREGKKVHVGCMGGHGRTGTLLAAVAAEMKYEDPVGFIRKVHCKKGVESKEQMDFLIRLYPGIPRHAGFKEGTIKSTNYNGYPVVTMHDKYDPAEGKTKVETRQIPGTRYAPQKSAKCIWAI